MKKGDHVLFGHDQGVIHSCDPTWAFAVVVLTSAPNHLTFIKKEELRHVNQEAA